MAWNHANRDVPYLRDHAAALKRYNAILPLQTGPRKGIRPVGSRKKTGQRIWVTPEGNVQITEVGWQGVTYVEITYYTNDVITVAWPSGYMGSSAMGFVASIIGADLNFRGNRPWIHNVVVKKRKANLPKWTGNDENNYDRIKGSFPLFKGQLLRLQREPATTGTRDLLLSDPIYPVTRSIHAKGAKQVREEYAYFGLYMKGLLGVRDTDWTDTDRIENLADKLERNDMRKLIESDRPIDHLRAVMWLARANRSWKFVRFGMSQDEAERWKDTKLKVLADYDRMILDWHEGRAYQWQTRYDGKVYRDNVKLNLGALRYT